MRIVIRMLLAGAVVFLGVVNAQAQCPVSQLVTGSRGPNSIPPLNFPALVSVEDGNTFLTPDRLVLGVVINGEARAYPHGVLWWHEIINDFLGGIPVTVTFCPLTGSGLIFNPVVDGTSIRFGTSGLIFDNNLVMFDEDTNSLWSQMGLGSICGARAGTAATLFPVVQTSWQAWSALYPESTVVTFNTGFSRNYSAYRMCPEVRGKRTAPSTPSSEYQIRRQPPRVREPRSDVGNRRCVVVESGQRR